MEFLLLRQSLIVVSLLIASYTDIKTGLIPDKITLPLIFFGIVLNLFSFKIENFLIPAGVFLILAFFYYIGKLGGGDVKLLTGISMVLPFYSNQIFVLPLIFFASLFSVLFFSAFYVSKYIRKGIDFEENRQDIKKATILGFFLIIFFFLSFSNNFIQPEILLLLIVPLILSLFFLAFQKGIRKNFFIEHVSLNKLDEDEMIAFDALNPVLRKKLDFGFKGVLGEKEISRLKKLKVKKVPVVRGFAPFAPFIFLGAITSFYFSHFFSFLF